MASTAPFRVICPEAVRQDILKLHKQAHISGIGRKFISAIEVIQQRLETSPQDFGEPVFSLKWPNAKLRKGAVAPLIVCFGVFHEEKLVVIFWFKLLSGGE